MATCDLTQIIMNITCVLEPLILELIRISNIRTYKLIIRICDIGTY
jgi:hypothetical protein